MNLREIITEARDQKKAIGHFNFSNLEQLKAIVSAAIKTKQPVILGLSEGERDFVGSQQAVAIIKSLREELDHPIFLNADHTYDLGKIKEAAEMGFDSVIFDGANLLLEENIEKTKEATEIAKKANDQILVEGEIGYIGRSSKILEELPPGAAIDPEDLPTAEQAQKLVEESGIDLLAPALGNIHGMFANAPNPHLDLGRIEEIAAAAKVPLVLHGGSGIRDEEFSEAIEKGIAVVHVSTELRAAWRESLESSLKEKPDEIAPYKLAPDVVLAIEKVVVSKLELFSKL